MRYIIPNFSFEWQEAVRYPEFKSLGKAKWVRFARTGGRFLVTKSNVYKIHNTDASTPSSFKKLELDKRKRALKSFKSGNIEMPVIAQYPDGKMVLIGGNTRLTLLMKEIGHATVWRIKVPNKL